MPNYALVVKDLKRSVNKNLILFAIIFITLFIADRITKLLIQSFLKEEESITLIKDILKITYIINKNLIFGIVPLNNSLIIFSTIVIIVVFIYIFLKFLRKAGYRNSTTAACILILAGGVSNLYDRAVYAGVVDFIDIGIREYRWPIFNLADIFVTAGLIIIILSINRYGKR